MAGSIWRRLLKMISYNDTIHGTGAAQANSATRALAPASARSVSDLSAQPAHAVVDRHRFVLGVFADANGAHSAIASLSASNARACNVILVSDAMSDSAEAIKASPSVVIHSMDLFSRVAPTLRDALSTTRPFAPLWDRMSKHPGRGDMPGTFGIQRLFHHLVHRLAKGAAVVAVRVPDPDLQLVASRILLDAKCEVLLAHEVVQSAN
jgi:hypothetical protein